MSPRRPALHGNLFEAQNCDPSLPPHTRLFRCTGQLHSHHLLQLPAALRQGSLPRSTWLALLITANSYADSSSFPFLHARLNSSAFAPALLFQRGYRGTL